MSHVRLKRSKRPFFPYLSPTKKRKIGSSFTFIKIFLNFLLLTIPLLRLKDSFRDAQRREEERKSRARQDLLGNNQDTQTTHKFVLFFFLFDFFLGGSLKIFQLSNREAPCREN